MNLLLAGLASPVVLFFIGAWLETVGSIDNWVDEFYSRWPLAAIGALVGALTVVHP